MAERSGGPQRGRAGSSAAPSRSRSSSTRSGGSTASRREAACRGGRARGRPQQARKAARLTAETVTELVESAGFSGRTVGEVGNALRDYLVNRLGRSFAITNYNRLTAAQVQDGLDIWKRPSCARYATTSAARRYRKTVLRAIESKLN